MVSPQLSREGVAIIDAKVRWVLGVVWGSNVGTRIITFIHCEFVVEQSWAGCETILNFHANIKLHLHSELGVLRRKLSITNSSQCKLRFFDEI